MFPMIPTTLRLSQHCRIDHTANPKRALVDVVRPRGLRIGDGCIIRLHSTDTVFCHTCCRALKTKKVDLTKRNWEALFIVNGFSNWKDSTRIFMKHDTSDVYKHAIEKLHVLPRTTRDIDESLNAAHEKEKRMNREYLLKVLQNILRFLARQGIALRGNGNEDDSYFVQLFRLRANDDSRIAA